MYEETKSVAKIYKVKKKVSVYKYAGMFTYYNDNNNIKREVLVVG